MVVAQCYLLTGHISSHRSGCGVSAEYRNNQGRRANGIVDHVAACLSRNDCLAATLDSSEVGPLAAQSLFLLLDSCADCRAAVNLERANVILYTNVLHQNAVDWQVLVARAGRGLRASRDLELE